MDQINTTVEDPRIVRVHFWLLLAFAPISLYMSGATVALLFVLAGVCLAGAQNRQACFAMRSRQHSHWWLLALLIYGLMSIGWARDIREAFYDWWRIALIVGSSWLLTRYVSQLRAERCRHLLQGVLWGTVLVVIFLNVEWLSNGALAAWIKVQNTSNFLFTSRACAVLAVLLVPMALYCRYRLGIVAAGLLILFSLSMIFVLPLLAAGVAVLLAGIVYLGQLAWPRTTPRVLAILFVSVLLFAPWGSLHLSRYARPGALMPVVELLPVSWGHRLVIWEFFARRIKTSPLLGHGLGTAHGLSEVPIAMAEYEAVAKSLGNTNITTSPPLHPHNGALQLWHDLGIIGVLGFIIWMMMILRGLFRADLPPAAVAACLASLTAWLTISGISFGFWQKWWLATGGIVFAICVLLLKGLVSKGVRADA